MKFGMNGKTSCEKITRNVDIKLHYVTNYVEREEVTNEYCPKDEIRTEFFTNPFVGNRFGNDKKKENHE